MNRDEEGILREDALPQNRRGKNCVWPKKQTPFSKFNHYVIEIARVFVNRWV